MFKKQENILEKIYDSALRFLTPLSLEETYELIIKEALRLVKAEFGSIFLPEDGEFKRVYTNNPALLNIKVRKKGVTYKVFQTGIPTVVHAETLRRVHPYKSFGIEVRSDVVLPLSTKGKPFGALSLMSAKEHSFTEQELELLKFFGLALIINY